MVLHGLCLPYFSFTWSIHGKFYSEFPLEMGYICDAANNLQKIHSEKHVSIIGLQFFILISYKFYNTSILKKV